MIVPAPSVCFSIDVERDYRLDGQLTARGVTEGLPPFVDLLRDQRIPFDVMVSAEIIPHLSRRSLASVDDLITLGCHGNSHSPGYLNKLSFDAQETDIRTATDLIRRTYNRAPVSFRAPNFSADGRTIRILKSLGYRADSSVLPGRRVKRWRILPMIDHRGTPESPYFTDESHFPMPGPPALLEIPVAPNRVLPGGPLGLGFLNSFGPGAFRKAMDLNTSPYIVILAHSWEMVSWGDSDPVAPWVRTASKSDTSSLRGLVESLADSRFVSTEAILANE